MPLKNSLPENPTEPCQKNFKKNRTKKTSPQEPSQDLPLLTRKTLLFAAEILGKSG
jgi:hypothetical protein